MDTSETYIKMCEKAEEIQECKPIAPVVYWSSSEPIYCGNDIYVARDLDSINFHIIWLPRQDQLQEIYRQALSEDERDSSNIWIIVLDDFYTWVFDELPKVSFIAYVSMEQLWLAFVMKEEYSKVWNGTDWVVACVSVGG